MKDTYDDLFTCISKNRNAIMGFAALSILFYHNWTLLLTNIPFISYIEEMIIKDGFIGVDIFFFLSGMGIAVSMSKKASISKFYSNRIKRIILPFVIYVIIYSVINTLSLKESLIYLSCIRFFTNNIYDVLWFIPSILIIYLLFPIYFKLISRAKDKKMFTRWFIILWLTILIISAPYFRVDVFGLLNRIPIISLGILLGLSKDETKIKADKKLYILSVISLLTGLFLLILYYYTDIKIIFLIPDSNSGVPASLVALGIIILLTIPLKSKLISKVLSWFGSFTLELYLVQELTRNTINQLFDSTSPIVTNIVSVLISIAAGYLLMLVSKSIMKILNRNLAQNI